MISISELAKKIIDIGLGIDSDPIRSIKGYYYSTGSLGQLTYSQAEKFEVIANLIKLQFSEAEKFLIPPPNVYTDAYKTTVTANFEEEFLDKFIDDILQGITIANGPAFKLQFKALFIKTLYEELRNKLLASTTYLNLSFTSNPLVSLKDQQVSNYVPSTYYDTIHNYNFYNNFETYVGSNINLNENLLPNLYFYQNKEAVLSSVSNGIKTLTTLFDTIPTDKIYTESYFGSWVESYPTFLDKPHSSITNAITDLLFVKKEDINYLQDSLLYRNNFPYYETIKFSTEGDSFLITKNIEEIGISCEYLRSYISSNNPRTKKDFKIVQQANIFNSSYSLTSSTLNCYNFENIISSSFNLERSFVTSIYSECETVSLSNLQKFLAQLRINNHLTKLSNDKFVNYSSFFEENLNLNETQIVLYTLEKIKVSGTTQILIQVLHFLNYDEIQDFIYHDTQIKYGENYIYRLKAQYATFGTEYFYSNVNTGSATNIQTSKVFYFDVNAYSVLKSVNNVILFEKLFCLRDTAPLPPQVNIVPYRGINNKLLFLFNTEIGSRHIEPIIIKTSDLENINGLRQTQEIETGPILYSSNDAPVFFEIYRTTTKPTKFEDFSNNLRAISLTNNAFSSEYEETVTPNTKYYYTFRCLDVHGNMSNPTYVYEVELVDDGGAVYEKINVLYDLNNDSDNYIKNVKRFLHVIPTNIQSTVVASGESLSEFSHTFGSAEDPVWNKDFKIRLKSKSTGKVIDVNVNFVNSSSIG